MEIFELEHNGKSRTGLEICFSNLGENLSKKIHYEAQKWPTTEPLWTLVGGLDTSVAWRTRGSTQKRQCH